MSLKILVPEGEALPPRCKAAPQNYKLQVVPGDFLLLFPNDQQESEGLIMLEKILNPGRQEQVGLLPHNAPFYSLDHKKVQRHSQKGLVTLQTAKR